MITEGFKNGVVITEVFFLNIDEVANSSMNYGCIQIFELLTSTANGLCTPKMFLVKKYQY